MISRHRQQGSVHVIVTVVLVIGLLAALGVIFWQNFVNKSDDSDTKATSKVKDSSADEESKPKLKQAAIDASFSSKLSFEYPENWKLDRHTDGPFPPNVEVGNTSERFDITSPSGKVVVRYSVVANGGLGGFCDDAEEGTITKLSYDGVPGFANGSLTETIFKQNGTYTFSSSIFQTSSVTKVKANDSKCRVYLSNVITLNEDQNLTLLSALIDVDALNEADGMPKQFNSVEEIEAQLKSDEYKQAKDILLSTKVSS